ncbi:S1 family peptidase [Streptosporangium canum]|uniref:S1 family peptidase n=1 Tax=Streptosporangium canum TaxID=324952 RepID=UPI00341CAF73
MSRRHVIAPGCVLAITALTLAVAPAAATRPAVPARGAAVSAKPPPGMLEALARDFGLTKDEAQIRLLNEARLTPIEASLRRRIGDHYAGAWLIPPRAQTLVVATTDPADASLITALDAQPLVVGWSLTDLERVKEKLSQALATLSSVRYVDVRTNKVVILTDNPTAVQKAIKTANVDQAAVQVTASTERPRLLHADSRADSETDLVGGQAYYVGATTRCSVGFSVTKGAQNGFVSAGHCGKPGSATVGFNRRPQGAVKDSAFPGDDFSWVAVNNDWTPQPLVGNDTAGTAHVYGARQAVVGASVCLPESGATLGWHCGTIQQHDVDVTYPRGVVDHLTRTSACGSPGDSGSSVLSADQAQGVVSGGSGSCDLAGFTYIQPIREILFAYDLTLMTSHTGPVMSTGNCGGYSATFTGTLKSSQFVYQPRNRHYHSTVNGNHYGCLESIPGSDLDLYLQKQIGSGWVTVASSDSSHPFEELKYTGTPGDYRYLVLASGGTSTYTLGYTTP